MSESNIANDCSPGKNLAHCQCNSASSSVLHGKGNGSALMQLSLMVAPNLPSRETEAASSSPFVQSTE